MESRDQFIQKFVQTGRSKGASQQEVSTKLKSALGEFDSKTTTPPTQQPKSIQGFANNVIGSGGKLIGDTVGAVANVFNPDMEKNTVANVAKLAAGTAQYLDPTQALGTQYEDKARAVGNFYKDRYGSFDKIGETLYNDPVGVVADVASVATGAGGLIKGGASLAGKAGMVSNAGKVANVGSKVASFGNKVDPLLASANVVGKGAGKVFSRVKPTMRTSTVNPANVSRLKEIASREGVSLPVSATTTNPIIRQGETLTAKGLFGRKVANRMDDFTNMPQRMLEKATNDNVSDISSVRNTLGQSVRNELKTFSKGFKQNASKVYDEIESELGDVVVTTDKTAEMIKKLSGQIELSAVPQPQTQKFLDQLLGNIGEQSTYARLNQTRKDIGQLMNSTDPVASGRQAQLKAIYSAIEQDLDSIAKNTSLPKASAVYESKRAMDSSWKDFSKLLNKQEGKQILGETIDIEDIVPKLYRPNNASSIKRLKQFVNPKTMQELGDTFITEIVNSTVGRDGLIDVQKWATVMRKWDKPTLREAVGDAGLKKLEEIGKIIDDVKFAKEQIEPINKTYNGSQTAMLANTSIGASSLIGSFITLNPVPILSYLLTSGGGSLLFGTEKGRNLFNGRIPNISPKLPNPSKYGGAVYNAGKTGRMLDVPSEQEQTQLPTPAINTPAPKAPVFKKKSAIQYPSLNLKGY